LLLLLLLLLLWICCPLFAWLLLLLLLLLLLGLAEAAAFAGLKLKFAMTALGAAPAGGWLAKCARAKGCRPSSISK
jgi:hypothetical protein